MTIITHTATTLALAMALAITLTLGATTARATVYGFDAVEGSFDAANYQLTVENVAGGASAAFTFSNLASDDSAITSLYWDFGEYASLFSAPASWSESDGVDYTGRTGTWVAAAPGNLPGGQTVDFFADLGMNPDSRGGTIHNGIGSGEHLSVVFDLSETSTYQWLLSALDSGEIRVGMHIQGLGEGGELSASGVTATPLPAAAWLLGSGLLGLVGLGRVRRIA